MPTEARGNYLPEPLTYARQRPVAEVMSNYLTTDGLKHFLYSGGPLRPEARDICHIYHMVNPALTSTSSEG